MKEIIQIIENSPAYLLFAFMVGILALIDKLLGSKVATLLAKKLEESRKKKYAVITNSIDLINKKVDTLQNTIVENRVKELSWNITNFETSIINGQKMSLDSYENIMDLIYEWEQTYADKHNGQIKDAIRFIRAHYDQAKLEREKKAKN